MQKLFVLCKIDSVEFQNKYIIRYDKKLMVIVRKIMSIREELIDKIFESEQLFLVIDHNYEERAKINAIK